MGEDVFDRFPQLTSQASEVLGYSVKELCLQDPNRQLNLTQYTQPALFVVNALSYLKLQQEEGVVPRFLGTIAWANTMRFLLRAPWILKRVSGWYKNVVR